VTDCAKLKAELLAEIAASGADGRYDDGTIDAIHAAIAELTPLSPIPRPIDEQAKVAGPWKSLFAQFGPKHTAGKPITHETSFKLLSFNNLPDAPLRLLEIEQEIHEVSKDYNNVHIIETLNGSVRAHLIVFGHYSIEPETPQRYGVEFSRVGLLSPDGLSDDRLRHAFGFAEDQPLDIGFKPPRLHSDVVYCDQDLRINFGSMGGVYVMTRLHHHGHSVAFP
jgi:PAP_fibrillin